MNHPHKPHRYNPTRQWIGGTESLGGALGTDKNPQRCEGLDRNCVFPRLGDIVVSG